MAQCLSGGSLTSRGDFLSRVYEAIRWLVVEGLTLLSLSLNSGDSVNRAVSVAQFLSCPATPSRGNAVLGKKKKYIYIYSIYTHTLTHTHTHTHIYIYIYIYACVCVCAYVCMYVCMYGCVCIYIYIYIV